MIVLVIILSIVFLGSLVLLGRFSAKTEFKPTKNSYINTQLIYQPLALLIGLASLLVTYFLNPENFKTYFKVGDLQASAEPLGILGISAKDNWATLAVTIGLIITFVTAVYMFLVIRKQKPIISFKLVGSIILPVLLFAAMNSFTEEAITRMGVISPLAGLYSPLIIMALSAILFGLPHYFGTPKGVVGILLASFLGFILAKSVYETEGIAIAWGIHFVQDVIIIGSLAVLSKPKASSN